jgi:hypothetical protein
LFFKKLEKSAVKPHSNDISSLSYVYGRVTILELSLDKENAMKAVNTNAEIARMVAVLDILAQII